MLALVFFEQRRRNADAVSQAAGSELSGANQPMHRGHVDPEDFGNLLRREHCFMFPDHHDAPVMLIYSRKSARLLAQFLSIAAVCGYK